MDANSPELIPEVATALISVAFCLPSPPLPPSTSPPTPPALGSVPFISVHISSGALIATCKGCKKELPLLISQPAAIRDIPLMGHLGQWERSRGYGVRRSLGTKETLTPLPETRERTRFYF